MNDFNNIFLKYSKKENKITKNNKSIEFQDINFNYNILIAENIDENLDWIFNAEKQFIKKIIIGNKIICEIPNNNVEPPLKTLSNNIFFFTGYKEWVHLVDRETYQIEIENIKRNVWIGEICYFEDILDKTSVKDIFTNDEITYFTNIDKNVPKKKIMYARCKKSMYLLDEIHRTYISKRKFKENDIVAIKSVAGSGKTTTLLELSKKNKDRKILYLAFNKSLITEIKDKIKKDNITNLIPQTFDALLYKVYVSVNGIEPNIVDIRPQFLGNIIEWFKSKPYKIRQFYSKNFIKFCNDIEETDMGSFCMKEFGKSKPLLEELWEKTKNDGLVTFETLRKQAFLNNWCKEYIDKNYDMIMIDETQDFDMIMLKMILNDTSIPKLFVGDPKQSIYEFRGCINAFNYLPKEALIIEFYSTFRIGNPACDEIRNKFKDCWMISKSQNETTFIDKFNENEKYTYLFRSWRILLETAEKTPNIWIYSYDKKINEIRNLHEKLLMIKNFDTNETRFEDDLPMFLKSLSVEQLEKLIENISNNIVEYEDSSIKLYTVHSYKGLEDENIRIAEDIDIKEEENIYYVATTRGKRKIMVDKQKKITNKEIINNIIIIEKKNTIKKEATDKITFKLFLEGKTVEEISEIRNLKNLTIENHIIENLPNDQYDINKIISKDEYEEIDNELKKYNYETLLKPIKDNISKKISYFKIKMVYKINKNNI